MFEYLKSIFGSLVLTVGAGAVMNQAVEAVGAARANRAPSKATGWHRWQPHMFFAGAAVVMTIGYLFASIVAVGAALCLTAAGFKMINKNATAGGATPKRASAPVAVQA